MLNKVEQLPGSDIGAYVRPATVIGMADDERLLVQFQIEANSYRIPAQAAAHIGALPKPDDRVLVAGDDLGSGYVIAVLATASPADTPTGHISAADGASACLIRADGKESIQIRDAEARLVFEYEPATGRRLVMASEGDLELQAPKGSIRMRAGRGIHIQGDDRLDLVGANGLHLSSSTDAPGRPTRLQLNKEDVALESRRLTIGADQGTFNIAAAAYHGNRLSATIKRAKMVFGKVETVANRLIERVGSSYRIVAHLHELKAGRVRTLVRQAFHLQSKNATVLADEDVRIDGNRVNLG